MHYSIRYYTFFITEFQFYFLAKVVKGGRTFLHCVLDSMNG